MRTISALALLGSLLLSSLAPAEEATTPSSSSSAKKKAPKKSLKARSIDEAPPSAKPDSTKNWRFSVGAAYSMLGKMAFDSVEATVLGFSSHGSTDIEWEDTFLLKADTQYNFTETPWALNLGVSADLDRKVKKITTKVGGETESESVSASDALKAAQYLIYGNGVFRWQLISLYAGPNFNLVKLKPASSSSGKLTVEGGLGFQLGARVDIAQRFFADLSYRRSSFRIVIEDPEFQVDYGIGQFSTIILGGGYSLP